MRTGMRRQLVLGTLLVGISAGTAVEADNAGIGNVNLAIAELRKGETEPALALLTSVIETQSVPPNEIPDVYYDRGNAYLTKRDYDRAIADFTAAISLRARFSDAFIMRGNARLAKGDPDGAASDFKAVVEFDPANASAHTNLGNIYRAKGEKDRALAEYDAAIQHEADAAA